ncbi:MAG: hypothetical protein DRP50_04980 [Thermotoga sp.]|nr:MAG: hypothetical protein DRP50_04980 [Thermotoga sp.]
MNNMVYSLILSSNRDFVSRLKSILADLDHEVKNISREIDLLNEKNGPEPALVFADFNSQKINGLQVCRFVSSGRIWKKKVPIILITNMNHSIVLDELSAAAGAQAIIYSEKSTNEEIKNIVRRVLEGSKIDFRYTVPILLVNGNDSSNSVKTMLEREGMRVKVAVTVNEINDFDFTVTILSAKGLGGSLLEHVYKIKQLNSSIQEILVNCRDISLSTLNQLMKLGVFKIFRDDFKKIELLESVLSADRVYRVERLRNEYERQNQKLLKMNQELDTLLHTTNRLFMATSLKEVLRNAIRFSKEFFPNVSNILFMKREKFYIRAIDNTVSIAIALSDIESGGRFIKREQKTGCIRIVELSQEGMSYISKYLRSITKSLILARLSYKGILFGYLLFALKDCELSGREISFLDYYVTQVSLAIDHVMMLEKITELSRIDGVTGINNRRYFEELYEKDFERAKRYKHSLSLIMIDINDFKLINDTFGHDVGDEVLYTVGQLIKLNTRKSDTVGRYGGDEFCVVLNETPQDEVINKMNELKKIISSLPLKIKNEHLNLSISAGVATYPVDAEGHEALLRVADGRMYEDKRKYKSQRGDHGR